MKFKVLLILIVFTMSMFLVACESNNKLDVEGYREGVKKSQKKRMPIKQKKEIEKSIFPNIKQK